MTYMPKPDTKVHLALVSMCREPDRVYSTADISEILECPIKDVQPHLCRLIRHGYVTRTKFGPAVRDQGYRIVRRPCGRLPIESPAGDGRSSGNQASTLSVLADEFDTIELESGFRFPRVPRSIFEMGGAA